MKPNLLLVATILMMAGCRSDHPEQRIHEYFGVPASTDTRQLRRDLFSSVPIGTSEQQLYERLKAAKISDDKLASWYPADKSGVVVFRTGRDQSRFNVVVKEYAVFFHLGPDRRVRDIEVKEWVTGL